jgi:DNA-directed RNA polymerase subunit RPC12/RpoP
MALETTNYQCPSCNGALRFGAESGMLECDYCGSIFTTKQIDEYYAAKIAKNASKARDAQRTESGKHAKAASPDAGTDPCGNTATSAGRGTDAHPEAGAASEAAPAAASPNAQSQPANVATPVGDPIQNYLKHAKWPDAEARSLRAYTCSSCGAQLLTEQTTAVTSCPYCGNPTVLPGQLDDMLRPDYVIPFKFTKQQAVQALKSYYQGKKLLPKGFADANHLEEIQGVYVPFWLFSGKANGSASYNATRVSVWSDSENTYTKTDFYKALRDGEATFTKVPVDGSSRMPDAHMDAIEPYDYSEMRPFELGYLPGYVTDRYDQDAAMCRERAEGRMRNSMSSLLRSTVTGYNTVAPESCSTNITWQQPAYALLPVWMLHTKYDDEDLLFAMNGQTGGLIGDLPVQKSKVALRFLMAFVPTLAILLIIVFAFLVRW